MPAGSIYWTDRVVKTTNLRDLSNSLTRIKKVHRRSSMLWTQRGIAGASSWAKNRRQRPRRRG